MAEEIVESEVTEELPEGAESRPSLLRKLLIIVPIVILALGLQTVAAYFTVTWLFFSSPPKKPEAPPGKTSGDTVQVKEERPEYGKGEIYVFEDIIVNPAGTLGRRYLVLSMSFEVSEKKALVEIEEKEPIIRDALLTLLASKTLDYVSEVANLESMRKQIKEVVNDYLDKGEVVRVYFTGYVLQ